MIVLGSLLFIIPIARIWDAWGDYQTAATKVEGMRQATVVPMKTALLNRKVIDLPVMVENLFTFSFPPLPLPLPRHPRLQPPSPPPSRLRFRPDRLWATLSATFAENLNDSSRPWRFRSLPGSTSVKSRFEASFAGKEFRKPSCFSMGDSSLSRPEIALETRSSSRNVIFPGKNSQSAWSAPAQFSNFWQIR